MPPKPNRDLQAELGRRLKALRRGRDWSQEYLAEKVEMSAVTLSRYETGERAVSLAALLALADALSVTPGDLLNVRKRLPNPPATPGRQERDLLRNFRRLDEADRNLAARLVREVARKK